MIKTLDGCSLWLPDQKRNIMSHKFLFNSTFHALLIAIDRELAENIRKKGCDCGGRLHQANYPRSPLGLLPEFRSMYQERFSFCCNLCRRRTTPPSVRFFGRRRYPASLLLLISAFMISPNERRFAKIKHHFGITVSETTWKRWRRWWRESFAETNFWKQARGLVPESKIPIPIVRRMLRAFQGTIDNKMIFLLKFISPITAGFLRAV